MLLSLFSSRTTISSSRLEGERLYLRAPEKHDWRQWVAARQKNAAAQAAFNPHSTFHNLTREGYFKRLGRYRDDWHSGQAYVFSIFENQNDLLIGGLTLNGIIRGAGQMAMLGYWLGEDNRGKGLMPEAVRLACAFAFERLLLHRIQAGCLPHNKASRRVLEKCGFSEEGLARKYLKIAGEWQDHVIYSRLKGDD